MRSQPARKDATNRNLLRQSFIAYIFRSQRAREQESKREKRNKSKKARARERKSKNKRESKNKKARMQEWENARTRERARTSGEGILCSIWALFCPMKTPHREGIQLKQKISWQSTVEQCDITGDHFDTTVEQYDSPVEHCDTIVDNCDTTVQ